MDIIKPKYKVGDIFRYNPDTIYANHIRYIIKNIPYQYDKYLIYEIGRLDGEEI